MSKWPFIIYILLYIDYGFVSDSYDAVVTTGSFVPGHVNEECYEELIRITKKGKLLFSVIICLNLKTK